MVTKKEAESAQLKVLKMKERISLGSKMNKNKLPQMENKTHYQTYIDLNTKARPTVQMTKTTSGPVKCILHRREVSPIIPDRSKSQLSINMMKTYFLHENKKPFKF